MADSAVTLRLERFAAASSNRFASAPIRMSWSGLVLPGQLARIARWPLAGLSKIPRLHVDLI